MWRNGARSRGSGPRAERATDESDLFRRGSSRCELSRDLIADVVEENPARDPTHAPEVLVGDAAKIALDRLHRGAPALGPDSGVIFEWPSLLPTEALFPPQALAARATTPLPWANW
jgi:hypothetical protein